jgi:hypothetical protein
MTSNLQTATAETYRELEMAYEHFKTELFDGELPPVLFTLQRQPNTMGYFSAQRFVRRDDGQMIAEIAVNPEYFAVFPPEEILSTVCHEAVHAWQWAFGTPSRPGYHNSQWADKMEAVGLMPSDTGKPGGKRVGQKMNDYPIQGGRFLAACETLFAKGFRAAWLDRYPPREALAHGQPQSEHLVAAISGGLIATDRPPAARSRSKFTCPRCRAAAWGKPSLRIRCDEHDVLMTSAAMRNAKDYDPADPSN